MATRLEIENESHVLGDDRWRAWMKCGVHNWQTLPQTDSGEHYCPDCCTLWTADGAIQNIPDPPDPKQSATRG
jgi:hypothetical protein